MFCAPGYYYVSAHARISKKGVRHKVDSHCRKNPAKKSKFLFASNLNYLFQKNHKKFNYKKLKRIKGYKDKGQYDQLVQFWLQYWRQQGLIKESIDPLLVKAMIAAESSFREKVITKLPNSTATGLMQITKTTMKILGQKLGKEIRKAIVDISQTEAQIANINIAAGTRWLIYKITTSPGKNLKSKNICWSEVLSFLGY